MRGVVIDTKLFARPKKDKDIRARSNKEVELLKGTYSKQLSEVREQMVSKMTALLEGKTSNGIKHKFGEEVMSKGVKFNRQNVENNLFPAKNVYRDESTYNVPEEANLISDLTIDSWTDDEHTNDLVFRLIKNCQEERNSW